MAYGYATAVVSWAALHFLFGDGFGWLFLLNTGAIYMMLLLPMWIIRPFITKHKLDICIAVLLIGIALLRFGGLLPTSSSASTDAPTLTVMTTNLLVSNTNIDGIETAFRSSDADIIAIQELSPRHARMLQNRLIDEYPYQLLDAQQTVYGMGIISRYPLEQLPLPFSEQFWIGTPQLVQIEFDGTPIQLINFHAIPPVGAPFPDVRAIRIRETQARQLATFAQGSETAVILLGDLNATDQSQAHAILRQEMQDSWHTAGVGLGNTWPGMNVRPFDLVTLPRWLARIDHIFVSHDLHVASAQIGPWDGGADHRPVIVGVSAQP